MEGNGDRRPLGTLISGCACAVSYFSHTGHNRNLWKWYLYSQDCIWRNQDLHRADIRSTTAELETWWVICRDPLTYGHRRYSLFVVLFLILLGCFRRNFIVRSLNFTPETAPTLPGPWIGSRKLRHKAWKCTGTREAFETKPVFNNTTWQRTQI